MSSDLPADMRLAVHSIVDERLARYARIFGIPSLAVLVSAILYFVITLNNSITDEANALRNNIVEAEHELGEARDSLESARQALNSIQDEEKIASTIRFIELLEGRDLESWLKHLDVRILGLNSNVPLRVVAGQTAPGNGWRRYKETTHAMIDVDISGAGFSSPPIVFTSIGGEWRHWTIGGATSIYQVSEASFRIHVKPYSTPQQNALEDSGKFGWHINWIAIGRVD